MVGTLLVLNLILASPPEEGRAVRAEIESTLSAMEAAALAGDSQGYLSHIGTDEARFAREMTNWAADLAKNTPRVFELEIVEDGAVFEPGRAEFEMKMKYSMPVAADPGDRSVVKNARFPTVVFEKSPDGVWRYGGEKWAVLKGEGFEVRYIGDFENVARTVLEAFPVARKHDDEGFEIPGTPHQVIKLYSDMEHLKATVYLAMPDPVLGGWNEAGESIKFLTGYAGDLKGWTRAFAHEYGHVATWEMGPKAGDMPWWVQEGVAELAAEAFDGRRSEAKDGNDDFIRRRARAGRLVPWEAISDYRTAELPVKHMAYMQGHHLIGYISDRWGRSGRNKWLRSMAGGKSLDDATRETFGMTFAELDRAWRATLPEKSEEKGSQ